MKLERRSFMASLLALLSMPVKAFSRPPRSRSLYGDWLDITMDGWPTTMVNVKTREVWMQTTNDWIRVQ